MDSDTIASVGSGARQSSPMQILFYSGGPDVHAASGPLARALGRLVLNQTPAGRIITAAREAGILTPNEAFTHWQQLSIQAAVNARGPQPLLTPKAGIFEKSILWEFEQWYLRTNPHVPHLDRYTLLPDGSILTPTGKSARYE